MLAGHEGDAVLPVHPDAEFGTKFKVCTQRDYRTVDGKVAGAPGLGVGHLVVGDTHLDDGGFSPLYLVAVVLRAAAAGPARNDLELIQS